MLQSADAVELALKLDGEELNKRKLRVQRCVKKPTKKSHSRMKNNFGANRKRESKKSFSDTKSNEQIKTVDEDENKDVLNISDSDKMPERKHTKPNKEFSQFQGQKIGEDKNLKKVMLHNVFETWSLTLREQTRGREPFHVGRPH
jgi:hypothetical protein